MVKGSRFNDELRYGAPHQQTAYYQDPLKMPVTKSIIWLTRSTVKAYASDGISLEIMISP